jgi:hypothetical protein
MVPTALDEESTPHGIEVTAEAPVEAGPALAEQAAPDATPADESPTTVPLARLQGVQRALSQAERERDGLQSALSATRQELAQAHARAAAEYAERLKSTQRDIVPDLIRGETIEEVDAALAASRAAFAAARQAYARTIPTPPVGNPPHSLTQPSAQPNTSPVQMISQGLRQPPTDINH